MQIHVVSQGQSIYGIAQAYSISPEKIISANQLDAPDRLVVGQALVIPITGRFYYVQPGDSLYTIARKFNMTPQQLASINRIPVNRQLLTGTRLYIPPAKKTSAAFNAYIEPRGTSVSKNLENSAREAAPHLTYLAPFSFEAKRDGSLKAPLLDGFPLIAKDNGIVLMMVVSNLEEAKFSDDLATVLLTDMNVQNKLLDNIEKTASNYGFRDIHFDFEAMTEKNREPYAAFLRRAKQRFDEKGWDISIAMAPKTKANQEGIWYQAHDYPTLGAIVDFTVIMTYEWGYSGGPAQAVSPIGPVRQVLEYAISEIPSRKVMMGQNLYGYDWTLPFKPGTTAKAVSPQQAIAIARENNAVIKYDETAQAPFFTYRDSSGNDHEVWFEDARSIQAKFNLLKELNLYGMSYWKLGLSFPQNWLLLENDFNVIKK